MTFNLQGQSLSMQFALLTGDPGVKFFQALAEGAKMCYETTWRVLRRLLYFDDSVPPNPQLHRGTEPRAMLQLEASLCARHSLPAAWSALRIRGAPNPIQRPSEGNSVRPYPDLHKAPKTKHQPGEGLTPRLTCCRSAPPAQCCCSSCAAATPLPTAEFAYADLRNLPQNRDRPR